MPSRNSEVKTDAAAKTAVNAKTCADVRKVAVIGTGSWGTAAAGLVAANADDVVIWARSAEVAAAINRVHMNPRHLTDYRLPAGVRRLADIMHDRIRSGGFAPFIGPLYDQDMTLRLEKGEALSRQDIIGMNYLVQNVVGTLPGADALTEAAQRLVRLQGFQNAAKASETAAHP